jgi:hypothetical protein
MNPCKQLCQMQISPAPLQVIMEVPQKKFKAGFPFYLILGIYPRDPSQLCHKNVACKYRAM